MRTIARRTLAEMLEGSIFDDKSPGITLAIPVGVELNSNQGVRGRAVTVIPIISFGANDRLVEGRVARDSSI